MAEEKDLAEFHPQRPELVEFNPRQRVKQQISVPYLWEEKPGKPKKDWNPKVSAYFPFPTSPKLIVSVPFKWEEKPGKPLEITHSLPDLLSGDTLPALEAFPRSPYHLNPFVDEKVYSSNPFICESEEGAIVSNLEAFSFDTSNEIFSVESLKPSDSWRSEKSSVNMTAFGESYSDDSSFHLSDNWFSPSEKDGHNPRSSYSGEVNTDNSVLEFLFPLSSPDVGFLKSRTDDVAPIQTPSYSESMPKSYSHEQTVGARRTLTLGELILLSRKLSCQRKQIAAEKRNHTMEDIKKNLIACFPFMVGTNKTHGYINSC